MTTKKRRFETSIFIPNGRDCPRCGHEVGWSPGLKSMWPVILTCPHCGEDLKYSGVRVVTAVILVMAFIVGVGAFFIGVYTVPFDAGVVSVAVTAIFIVILWIPVVILAGMYLRSHKLLVRRDETAED